MYSQFLLPYEGYFMFSQNSVFDYVIKSYAYTLKNVDKYKTLKLKFKNFKK